MKILVLVIALAAGAFAQSDKPGPGLVPEPKPVRAGQAKIVTAEAGDNVAKLAARHDIDPNELAKVNGLLPNSVLGAGRQLNVPSGYYIPPTAAKRFCHVKPEAAPTVRGVIKLGMQKSEYDRLLIDDNLKIARIPGQFRDREKFAGVKSVEPTFFNDRLQKYVVQYDGSLKWDGDEEFAYVIATEFNLPLVAWQSYGSDGLAMSCDGFTLFVEANRMELRDENIAQERAKATVAKAAAAAEEQERKKKSFKP